MNISHYDLAFDLITNYEIFHAELVADCPHVPDNYKEAAKAIKPEVLQHFMNAVLDCAQANALKYAYEGTLYQSEGARVQIDEDGIAEEWCSGLDEWVLCPRANGFDAGKYIVKGGKLVPVAPTMPLTQDEIEALPDDAWLTYFNSWRNGVKYTFFYRNEDSWTATLPEGFDNGIGSIVQVKNVFAKEA